jgi:hypothetical protein
MEAFAQALGYDTWAVYIAACALLSGKATVRQRIARLAAQQERPRSDA